MRRAPARTGVEPLTDALLGWRELIGFARHSMPNNRHFCVWRILIGNRVRAGAGTVLTGGRAAQLAARGFA